MILELKINDPRLAARLLSYPVKNKTSLFMYVKVLGFKSPWLLVDGCFER